MFISRIIRSFAVRKLTYTEQKMKKSVTLLLAIVLSVLSMRAELDSSNATLLDSLRFYIANIDELAEVREQANDLDKQLLRQADKAETRISLAKKIGSRYLYTNLDSAMMYMRIAYSNAKLCNDVQMQKKLIMNILALLPPTGISAEALEGLSELDYKTLPDSLKQEYWRVASEIYYTVQLPYPQGAYKEKYRHLTLNAIDSLQRYYPHGSPVYHYLNGLSFMLSNEENLATANFVDVLPKLGNHPELKDFAMKKIIEHYSDRPEYRQAYLNYLLQRGINTLNRGIVRPPVMALLGEELIAEGYDDIGKECITLALETPDYSYTSPYSTFDRSHYSRLITMEANTMRRQIHTIIFISIIVLIALLALITRQHLKLNEKKAELESALLKIEEISNEALRTNQNVISLAFLAFEQLHDYNVHVLRKLMAGQAKDLYHDVEKGEYLQRMSEKYFEVFDSNILSTFPDFVEKINALLLPDKKLSLLPGDRLSPELRIAAFMRLGVTDSTKLSQALGLSLNTIYTYRNRLRGRALDRESFENDVRKII